MIEWSRENRYRKIEEAKEEEILELNRKVKECQFRQKYHIQPPTGLLNDPNGFSFYNGKYQLFYQWFPLGPIHGLKYWYHTSSIDLVNWENHGVGIEPGDWFDSHGAFSGSGIVDNDKLYLFYTGNTRDKKWNRIPYQCLAIMDKENNIIKYKEPIISKIPEGYTEHFRDPKVFKVNGEFYLIIGIQNSELKGRIVYYKSKNLINWEYRGEIKTSLDNWGFMWECPDYLEMDNKGVIIFSPQGLDKEGDKYANIYQSGYIVGEKLNLNTGEFNHGDFVELDNGFDFYAPQTTKDPNGRRILIGWMGLPEIDYPTDKNGWAHCLTLPRELKLNGDKLIQTPVEELKKLRRNNRSLNEKIEATEKAFDGFHGEQYELNCEVKDFEFGKVGLKLRVSENEETVISYDIDNNKLTLDRSKSGEEFALEWGTTRSVDLICKTLKLRVFVDTSSIEVFINDGEKVLTSRIFPSKKSRGIKFFATEKCSVIADIWSIAEKIGGI